MKKIKIALLIGSLTGGGAERVTCNLANYLNEKGYDVTLITMIDIKDTYELNDGVNRCFLLKNNERKHLYRDYKKRFKNMKDYLYNNQDLNCLIVMLPITILLAVLLKKYTKAKLIISERNNPNSYKFYEKLIMRYASTKCDGLVVQTKKIGEWYSNDCNKVIIPNAINKGVAFDDSKEKYNKIIAVGRLEKQKNYPMLLKAFVEISKKLPNYILEIYGDGKEKKYLVNMVKKLNIEEKVIFKGYVKDPFKCIRNAKLYILTSNYEGMPNSLIEAMCNGLPCISTDCDGGGASDLINNGVNGVLIKKNDVDALIKWSIEILNNDIFRKKISKNAIELRTRLSYNQIYSEWERYINNICNK